MSLLMKRIRDWTRLPAVLKGVQHPAEAALAAEVGWDAIVVSNHGGRQVDGAVGSAAQLAACVDAVAGRLPVLFDSRVRGGADIVKALALGAGAVLLGRPYLRSLAVDGEAGVVAVIDNMIGELDLAMGLAGVSDVNPLCRQTLGL